MEGWLKTQAGVSVADLFKIAPAPAPYVEDGLTLYLDATSTASYPGSGSTWTDLAQGLSFTSQNTQTPLQTVAGVRCFTFNNSGWWRHNTTPSLVDMGGPTTLILWVYNTGLAARKTVFEKAGTSYQSYEQEIAVTWETSDKWSYYSRYNTYDYGAFTTTPRNQWSMNAIKMTTAKVSGVFRQGFRSLNGAAWVSDYTARSTTPVLAAGEIRVGTGYAGTMTNSSISIVMVYNRELTNDEILKNYNAFKDVHGL